MPKKAENGAKISTCPIESKQPTKNDEIKPQSEVRETELMDVSENKWVIVGDDSEGKTLYYSKKRVFHKSITGSTWRFDSESFASARLKRLNTGKVTDLRIVAI